MVVIVCPLQELRKPSLEYAFAEGWPTSCAHENCERVYKRGRLRSRKVARRIRKDAMNKRVDVHVVHGAGILERVVDRV